MRIGESYDKISFDAFGLELLEPNAFAGDMLLFFFSLFFAYKIRKMNISQPFFRFWIYFFLFFGVSFFLGGFGHLLYNYWDIPGKTPSWYLGIIAVYFIESAMISIHPNRKLARTLSIISSIKLVFAIIAAICVNIFVDLAADYSKGMIVPTINSTIGLVFSLGVLGFIYSGKIRAFKYFWISVLLLLPAVFLQSQNINFARWFDKNDASHVLLIVGLCFYYFGVRGYANHLSNSNAE